MSQLPPRPNASCLLHCRQNQVKNDRRWQIELPAVFAAAYAAQPDVMRHVRKTAVREREFWGDQKKTAREDRDLARFAKDEERLWLQRERAAGLLVSWTTGSKREELETYFWPCELAPALEWAISEACLP